MSFMLKSVVVALIICSAFSYLIHAPPGTKKTVCKHGKCIDYCLYDTKTILPGESLNEGCQEVECYSDFSMLITGCGYKLKDNCTLTPDFTLKFPGLLIYRFYNNFQ